ncbi:putative membrane protein [Bacillus sp. SLBN-46]|uniref:hypothetical protein n=1 Tax=Bacillus sp. SLBN-46 TaxID=3042283 RepID=UPI002859C417|nr:hypothetical protein [Bacillus sp. SLBN-46]MDR6121655.1 putative membrane protein [Bacillus sp. SLBN-46]
MLLLLLLGIGFYLYKTGELQNISQKFQGNENSGVDEARRVIDMRYAAGQITAEEYSKIKNLL